MALGDNIIGVHRFIALLGSPELLQEQLEIVVRPGVPGSGFWRTGARGSPFQLRSQVDAESMAHAFDLFAQYKQLVGGDPVPVLWAGIDLTGYSVGFVVLDVRPLDIASLGPGTPGIHPPSFGWCDCVWTLCPVPVDTSSDD